MVLNRSSSIFAVALLVAHLGCLNVAHAANLCADLFAPKTQSAELLSGNETAQLSKIFESRIFDQKTFYSFMQGKPEFTRDLLRNWYGAKFVKEWGVQVKFETLDATVLLLDPGIVDRIGEFVGFSRDHLQKFPQATVFELRTAFAKYLGQQKVYRAMVLTEAQALEYARKGLQSPGLFFKTDSPMKWFEKKNKGPVHDFVERVLEDSGTTGMTLSVSEHKEIAISAASYRFDGKDASKSVYLFEIVTNEINIVRENQKVSTLPAFKKLKENIADTAILIKTPDGDWYNSTWSTGETEAFLLNHIPASDIKSVVKIEDRRSWDIETFGSSKGTTSLDKEDLPPKRKFQVLEDPDGFAPFEE